MQTFHDSGETVYDFHDDFLVVCPRCQHQAVVTLLPKSELTARVVCTACGYNATQTQERVSIHTSPHDWYFDLPLWLQTPCCGEILWARNHAHLRFLEQYLSSRLRRRTPNINKSMASRLPRWMTSAKNRVEVMNGIERLKERITER